MSGESTVQIISESSLLRHRLMRTSLPTLNCPRLQLSLQKVLGSRSLRSSALQCLSLCEPVRELWAGPEAWPHPSQSLSL